MSNGQGTKFEQIDALRDCLNRLHAERGAAVVVAKDFRHGHGITSETFKRSWNVVEKLTGQIEQAQRELDAAVREAAVCVMPTAVVCELVQALDDIRMTMRGNNGTTNGTLFDLAKDRARKALAVWEDNQTKERHEVCQAVLADMDEEDRKAVAHA